jgi:alkanesulfonate monooxygenase SsuD/methylene tetrahydromethanopterin reductase-like flavin-dependent oxidoreductase (luciferase family)
MKVGLSLPQNSRDGAGGWPAIRELAEIARVGGADSLWVADHFFHRAPDDEVGLYEPFELLAAVAAVTPGMEIGPLVAATSFRSPGLLAKMAATLDAIAGGRLILGVGCGWHEPEYRAFGYPFDHRVGRFEEAIRVVRGLLDGERVTFSGTWITVDDAVLLPAPRRRIPLLMAADGPRMLRLTARYGDAWQAAWFAVPDASFREQRSRLQDACGLEGRSGQPDVFVGINVGEADDPHVALDAAAVADALEAWALEGVAHVQIGAWPATPATWEPVLEGIQHFRRAADQG